MTLLTEAVPENASPVDPWEGFAPGPWRETIDIRDFIQRNYTPYAGDASFLAGPTTKTLRIWETLEKEYLSVERARRVYDVDTETPARPTRWPWRSKWSGGWRIPTALRCRSRRRSSL